MIQPNALVRLDKLSAENTPEGMLPTGYWLKGHLLRALAVGSTIHVWRIERAARNPGEVSPVKLEGEYESSPVVEIAETTSGSVICLTANSHWKITPL